MILTGPRCFPSRETPFFGGMPVRHSFLRYRQSELPTFRTDNKGDRNASRITVVLRILFWLVAILGLPSANAASQPANSIVSLIEYYNALNSRQPHLSVPDADGISRLMAGEVVSYSEKIPGPGNEPIHRVVAYVLVAEPRIKVWTATLGGNQRIESKLIELPLSIDSTGGAVWYQYLSLPWPIADRHWVLKTGKRLDLAERSDHRIWEQSWDLEPLGADIAADLIASGKVDGVKPNANRKAVYLPANSGGWIMARVDADSTLVAVHATAELGGRLPDAWVTRYARRKLSNVLGKLTVRTQHAKQALNGRIPLYTGDGQPITLEMLSISDAT